MSRHRNLFAGLLFGLACWLVPPAHSQPAQPKAKVSPRLEAVAETKLLMEGLASPNARALGKLLADRPKDAEGWAFARGQALLLAETGNLLMLRPPKTKEGQEPWLGYAAELREQSTAVAKAASAKDYPQARAALAGVANACNRCHQAFRVPVRVDPFAPDR